jgi:hypothetical protein
MFLPNKTTAVTKLDKIKLLAEVASNIWIGPIDNFHDRQDNFQKSNPSFPATLVFGLLPDEDPNDKYAARLLYIKLVTEQLEENIKVEDSSDYDCRGLIAKAIKKKNITVPCKTVVKIDPEELTLVTWKAYGNDIYNYKFVKDVLIETEGFN